MAARNDVSRLLAEVRALREEVRNLSEALGFGDGITEPAASLTDLIDSLQDVLHEVTEHEECPIWCALCGERLADTRCRHCQGSGSGPGTASICSSCWDYFASGAFSLSQ